MTMDNMHLESMSADMAHKWDPSQFERLYLIGKASPLLFFKPLFACVHSTALLRNTPNTHAVFARFLLTCGGGREGRRGACVSVPHEEHAEAVCGQGVGPGGMRDV